jgi:hypothetical protein
MECLCELGSNSENNRGDTGRKSGCSARPAAVILFFNRVAGIDCLAVSHLAAAPDVAFVAAAEAGRHININLKRVHVHIYKINWFQMNNISC